MKEMLNYIIYRSLIFYNTKSLLYYFYYLLMYIPFGPILFEDLNDEYGYVWGRFGTYFIYKRILSGVIDSNAWGTFLATCIYIPSLFYLLFCNNKNDLNSISNSIVRFMFKVAKYVMLILFLIGFMMFCIRMGMAAFPWSLISPIVWNGIYVWYEIAKAI